MQVIYVRSGGDNVGQRQYSVFRQLFIHTNAVLLSLHGYVFLNRGGSGRLRISRLLSFMELQKRYGSVV